MLDPARLPRLHGVLRGLVGRAQAMLLRGPWLRGPWRRRAPSRDTSRAWMGSWILGFWLACSASAADPARLTPCATGPDLPPILIDLSELAPGARQRLEVRWDGTGWASSRALEMPLHHASRIEWENLHDFPELSSAQGGPVWFTFVLSGREVRPGPDVYRATYFARMEAVCIPRAAGSGAP